MTIQRWEMYCPQDCVPAMVTEHDGEWCKWADADREIAVLNRMTEAMALRLIGIKLENGNPIRTAVAVVNYFRAEAEKETK